MHDKAAKHCLRLCLQGHSDEELGDFVNGACPDDATLSILRSVLGAAGQLAEEDWDKMKGMVTLDLLDKVKLHYSFIWQTHMPY